MAGGLPAVVRRRTFAVAGTIVVATLALLSGAALAQQEPKPETAPAAGGPVVAYCIEPMDSMPPKIAELIQPQFRCEPGTHLKRDSRPARVVPSGEGAERPFVIRFGPPDKVNAWFVRGFATEPGK